MPTDGAVPRPRPPAAAWRPSPRWAPAGPRRGAACADPPVERAAGGGALGANGGGAGGRLHHILQDNPVPRLRSTVRWSFARILAGRSPNPKSHGGVGVVKESVRPEARTRPPAAG